MSTAPKHARLRQRLAGLTGAAATGATLLVAPLAAPTALAAPASSHQATGWIITAAPGTSADQLATVVRQAGGSVDVVLRHALTGVVAQLDAPARARLAADTRVAALEADQPTRTASVQPLDEEGQWGLDLLDQRTTPLDHTFSTPMTGAGVSAYIVDTGIDASHPDLAGRVRAGYDAIHDGRGTNDCLGHGTEMAGLVAGTRYGVAKQATLVPVRVQACDYGSSTARYLEGIDWMVADHQAGTPAVANMSFDEAPSQALDDAVRRALADGISVVAAAGNTDEGRGTDSCQVSPGRVQSSTATLTVGGIRQTWDGKPTWWDGSLQGGCIDLLAPAYGITSDKVGGGSGPGWGTSQATALTSGAVALVRQAHPGWNPWQVAVDLINRSTTNAVTGVPAEVPNRLLNISGISPVMTASSLPAPSATTRVKPAFPGSSPTPTPSASSTPAPTPSATAPATPSAAPLPALRATATPRVTGRVAVGSTVTTDLAAFTPTATTRTARWYRVTSTGRALVGTGRSHAVVAADRGQRLQACITATRSGYRSATSCTTTAVVAPGRFGLAHLPTVSGSAAVGKSLTAGAGSWSPTPATVRYQWQRVSSTGRVTSIPGATSTSHRATSADRGHKLRVRVTVSRDGYTSRTATSATSGWVR